jgi:hypothetical protein
MEALQALKLPDSKVLIPGVIESKSNFIEHPELVRNASATRTLSAGKM